MDDSLNKELPEIDIFKLNYKSLWLLSRECNNRDASSETQESKTPAATSCLDIQ